MQLYEYNQLGAVEKHEIILKHGTVIATRYCTEYFIILYGVFNFYVEAWYTNCDKRFYSHKSFKSLGMLQIYLDEITVTPEGCIQAEDLY